jgi:ribonucleotide reductase beta subunit family protein with ferritin-like domain
MKSPLVQSKIEDIIKEAVEIEIEFINHALPCKLIGMNADLMSEYIKFIADRLIVQLGYNKIYNSKNPFSFMELISLESKTNFFEKKVDAYSLSNMENKHESFNFTNDF